MGRIDTSNEFWKSIHYWEDGRDELYNLAQDIHEDHDLAAAEPERAKQMSEALMGWLNDTGAKFPKPDPLYDEAKEQVFIAETKARMTKRNEDLRKEMLDKDWQPNKNWWGSIQTVD